MAKYTIDLRHDSLDDIYPYTDTNEDLIQLLNDSHIVKYRTKTIKSGNVLECEIYPIWNTRKSTPRAKKVNQSRKAQQRLNANNATKNLIRLINTNFTDDDIWGTFTYENKKLPSSIELAEKEMQKFFRRLKYYAKKHDYPPLKYIYLTEFEDDEEKGKKRVHHHFVTNFPDRDVAEKLWRNGARTQTRRLQADENGYEGMARYISKDPKGTKRYIASRNLKKPQITVADCKFSCRRVNRLALGTLDDKTTFEKIYNGYNLLEFTAKWSDFITGTYLYAKMAKQQKPKQKKKQKTG